MTGPSGSRLSICPLRFGLPPQEFLLTSAVPRSIETLGEAILNLSGQTDLPFTLETSHYLFNNILSVFLLHKQFIPADSCINVYMSAVWFK